MQPIVIPKHVWERLILKLPATDKLFAHDQCPNCRWPDGSHLRASTISHVGLVAANAADADGSNIYRGIASIAEGAKRSPRTVVAALGHLQTVGLLIMEQRGGGRGRRKGGSSIYSLAVPGYDVLTVIGVDIDALVRSYEHLQQIPQPHDWFARTESSN